MSAKTEGAIGVIIFNEWNDDLDDDRFGPVYGTLDARQVEITVIGTTYAVDKDLGSERAPGDS